MLEKVYTSTNPGNGRVSVCLLIPEEPSAAEAKLLEIAGNEEETDLPGALNALADVVDESLHPPE